VPRTALTGLVTGLALVVVAVLLWPVGAGISPAPVPAPIPAAVPAVVPAAVIAPASAVPLDAPPVGAPLAPAAPAQPAQVRIGTIAAAAPVVAVGVDERGAMAVPEDVRTVGWYRFGSRPGSLSGSAVLSGHVDDRVQGRGVFAALGDVDPGDLVEVELTDGTRLGYRVRTVERVAKDALPADQLFARSGPPRLTLITCGGDFDWTTRTHTENVVVTAEPAR
jgi:LPXTG-site transpeptidase (sortase) family protein